MDILSDSLSRMQVAISARKKTVKLTNTNLTKRLVFYLIDNGFLSNYRIISSTQLLVYLKYLEGRPFVYKYIRISKPGRRVYINSVLLRTSPVYRKMDNAVLSTSKFGFISVKDALLKKKLGGELLFNIQLF
jgi:small subunit ribosomal protein S8